MNELVRTHPLLRPVLFVSFILIAFGCSSNRDKLERLMQLRELAELGTVEYSVSKIILASDDQTWYKLGDRKVLFSCEAKVKAGIDLSKLNEDDVVFDGDKVTVYLPPAQLIYLNMDPEKIKEEFSDVSWSRMNFSTQEKDEILVQGQKNIEEHIMESDIMSDAEKNARTLLVSWLKQAGFNDVEVLIRSSNNPAE